jgi:hypothetical protein
VLETVAVLLPGVGSSGNITVAVFVNVPVADDAILPLTT